MILDRIDLDAFYSKAKIAFAKCVENEEALILEEIGAPIDSVTTKNEWVKVQFWGSDKSSYIIETRLLLFLQSDDAVGWYCYHEDENGQVVDDYLVFE